MPRIRSAGRSIKRTITVSLSPTQWAIVFEALEHCHAELPVPERREDYPEIMAYLRKRGVKPPYEMTEREE